MGKMIWRWYKQICVDLIVLIEPWPERSTPDSPPSGLTLSQDISLPHSLSTIDILERYSFVEELSVHCRMFRNSLWYTFLNAQYSKNDNQNIFQYYQMFHVRKKISWLKKTSFVQFHKHLSDSYPVCQVWQKMQRCFSPGLPHAPEDNWVNTGGSNMTQDAF